VGSATTAQASMNTLSLKFPTKVPRVWLLLLAFLIPQLAFAGVFYNLPATAPVGSSYSVNWYGPVSMTSGTYASMQTKAPGASTWTTVGSGVSGYYGSCTIPGYVSFNVAGTWTIRIVRADGGLAQSTTVQVTP
jgi:hypothetical protein